MKRLCDLINLLGATVRLIDAILRSGLLSLCG